MHGNSYSQFGLRGRAPRGVTGELSPASVYVSLLPVVEACVVVAVPGRVGEVRVAADEPEAVDLDPGVEWASYESRRCAAKLNGRGPITC